jgi:protein-S-isoprenylcysteine O-methyltransferase Ste14
MTSNTSASQKTELNQGVVRWAVKTAVTLLIFGAVLFASAGRLNWTAGWIYLALVLATQLISAAVLLPTRPDLLVERSQMQEGTKTWDKFLSVGMALFGPLAIFIAAGLDARFGWTGSLSPLVQVVGLALALAGSLFSLWSMVANAFFASTVRIQTDRGHQVVQSGPYGFVRHPGYAGMIVFDLATPLALLSLWAFIPALLTVVIIVVRTALEDRTLQQELPGYAEYARRVRARLLPGIF